MLVKKKEENNIIEAIYSSTNVIASNYDRNTNDLILTFIKGGRYKYKNVPINEYIRFEIAESQGDVFYSHIKLHTTEKLTPINTATILTEIQTSIKTENDELLKNKLIIMISNMKQLIELSETNSNWITENKLQSLKTDIDRYVDQLNQKSK